MRKFGWKANLRNPHLEVMNIHLDFYTTASSTFHTFQVELTSTINSMSTWIQQPVSLRQLNHAEMSYPNWVTWPQLKETFIVRLQRHFIVFPCITNIFNKK